MPHVVYLAASVFCPWPNCDFRIELIDFQLEKLGDPALYTMVMSAWGQRQDFGLVARCPQCGEYVRFGMTDKQAIVDAAVTGLPVLPDDWHASAFIS